MSDVDMSAAGRVTCPLCSRPDRALTKTGRITQHVDPKRPTSAGFSGRCPASGKRPSEFGGDR